MPERNELLAALDSCCDALAANDATRIRWASDARYTENCVEFPAGDGVWATCTAVGDYQWSLADPLTGQAARFGTLDESGDGAIFVMRICLTDGVALTEMEMLIARTTDSGVFFLTPDLSPRPELCGPIAPEERASRERMLELANGYFDTLQRNDGTLHTKFHADCNRRENGVFATNNPRDDLADFVHLGCEDQFRLGYYRFDNWIRARRYPLVDEVEGVVLSGGFIDHDGQTREYTLTNGEKKKGFFLRPHSFSFLEAFKIKGDAISAVEAVFHYVPYRLQSPWADDGTDPRLAETAAA